MKMNQMFDIDQRSELWSALANLFLDTDVSTYYEYISDKCAASKYTISEMKDILFNEVAPVCYLNLFCVTGEWNGFDEVGLKTAITENLFAKGLFPRIKKFFSRWFFEKYTEEHWAIIESKIHVKRKAAQLCVRADCRER